MKKCLLFGRVINGFKKHNILKIFVRTVLETIITNNFPLGYTHASHKCTRIFIMFSLCQHPVIHMHLTNTLTFLSCSLFQLHFWKFLIKFEFLILLRSFSEHTRSLCREKKVTTRDSSEKVIYESFSILV